jgi:predicted secreted Zn-dependent protease
MGNALVLALALALTVDSTATTATGADGIPVAIDEKLVNYAIEGDTASELLSQMDRLGPFDQHDDSKRFQAYTSWNVRWNYMMMPQPDGRCRLEQIAVTLQVTMTLPAWQPKRHADSLLESRWPTYLAGLTNHEMGHRANGVRAAFAVRDALAAVAPSSCKQLGEFANAAAMAALDARKGADADYDRETEHGKRQIIPLR